VSGIAAYIMIIKNSKVKIKKPRWKEVAIQLQAFVFNF
jgi:hypothetical protein